MGKTLATAKILATDLSISERHVTEIFREFRIGEYYDYRACTRKYLSDLKTDTIESVTQKTLSELLGVSQKTIRNLTSENVLEKNEKEMYNLKQNFKKYIDRTSKSNELNLIKVESEKMKLEILKDEYLPVWIFRDMLSDMTLKFRSYLLGVSRKITIEIEQVEKPNIKKIVEMKILKAIDELSKFDPPSNKDI